MRKFATGAFFIFAIASCGMDEALDVENGRDGDGSGDEEEVVAFFEGEEINLAGDWGDAQSCVIWPSKQVAECFRDEQDAEQLELTLTTEDLGLPPQPTKACSRSCLHLYEHNNFGGRHLTFCDRGYWQNLTSYGFNDQLSSYKTGVHSVSLSQHINGGGSRINAGACLSSGAMPGGWNDQVSAIRIN